MAVAVRQPIAQKTRMLNQDSLVFGGQGSSILFASGPTCVQSIQAKSVPFLISFLTSIAKELMTDQEWKEITDEIAALRILGTPFTVAWDRVQQDKNQQSELESDVADGSKSIKLMVKNVRILNSPQKQEIAKKLLADKRQSVKNDRTNGTMSNEKDKLAPNELAVQVSTASRSDDEKFR